MRIMIPWSSPIVGSGAYPLHYRGRVDCVQIGGYVYRTWMCFDLVGELVAFL